VCGIAIAPQRSKMQRIFYGIKGACSEKAVLFIKIKKKQDKF
jgi:hypothetical protein